MQKTAQTGLNLISIPVRIKGTFLPATLLQPVTSQLLHLRSGLEQRLQEGAASLLCSAPVVLDLSQLPDALDFPGLLVMCRELQIQLVAVRTNNPELQQQAQAAGLVALNEVERAAPAANQESLPRTRIHEGAVRGGQQILCETGDLIILGAVNPGAEVLASGHIHVYGKLQGRALAGIHGDQQARIFAHQLNAELLAIAGCYLTGQAAMLSTADSPVCIELVDNKLTCRCC